jgi:hypothetical protein
MTRDFPAGNYRFIPAVFQYSSGAAADPGYGIYPRRGAAPDVVLRMRIALARGLH